MLVNYCSQYPVSDPIGFDAITTKRTVFPLAGQSTGTWLRTT